MSGDNISSELLVFLLASARDDLPRNAPKTIWEQFKSRRPDHQPKEKVMRARIYQPARNAMQSGRARTKLWLLEFEPHSAREIDPLMGWTSSSDMLQQVQLEFDTPDEAVAYAVKHGIAYQV